MADRPSRMSDDSQEKEKDYDRELLIRLDERMSQIQRQLESVIISHAKYVESSKSDFVTKTEFQPVQRAVYAAIGFIVMGVLGGFMTLFIRAGAMFK